MIIVCDIDGTLANVQHRVHRIAESWDAFHSDLLGDGVYGPTLAALNSFSLAGFTIVFLTGRPRNYEAETIKWLSDNCGFDLDDDFEALLMRGSEDYRPDVEVKSELLSAWLHGFQDEDPDMDSILILDDRDKVVTGWRDLGYTCWQVRQGDY